MPETTEILLLGELSVRRGGRPVALPASKKTRALLGYLALSGRAHSREELCDLLWQGPDDPRAALRWSLTKLRGVLGTGAIAADRERIGPIDAKTDLGAVRERLRGGIDATESAELADLFALFRGELLEGLTLADCYRFHEWSTREREAARTLRIRILDALVERSTSTPETALSWARERAAIDPLSEASHIALIHILAELGRRRDALTQYETCCRILERELGRQPSPALVEAKMRIGGSSRIEAAPDTSPPEIAPNPLAGVPFVGRLAELARVDKAVDAALAGRAGPALVVTGEPGIGKTRLLDAAAERMKSRGGLVLSARAFESETARAYGPWIDAFRAVVSRTPTETTPFLLQSAEATTTGAIDRAGLFENVLTCLVELSSRSAVAILIDDLQWCDAASISLLHFVERELRSKNVAILLAARGDELSDNVPAWKLVRGLGREPSASLVELGPLDPEALAALVHELGSGADVERIARQSAGNPLFAIELLRAGQQGDPTGWTSIDGLISERLLRLDDRARDLLAWASAFGSSFDIDRLQRVLDLSPVELDACLAELERRVLIRVSSDGRGYDFVHDLVRDSAYREISEPRRRNVHRAIAHVLELDADRDGSVARELMRHAALGGEPLLSASAALAAAERALRMFALTEAARLADAGLQQLEHVTAGDRVRLEIGLLAALIFSGAWVRRAPRIERDLRRAIHDARELGFHAEAAHGWRTLSVMHYDSGNLGAAHETTLQAADFSREADPLTLATQLADSARCLALLERDVERAHAMYDEARAICTHVRDEPLAVAWAGAILAAFSGDQATATARFELVLGRARSIEDRWIEYECLRQILMIEIESDPIPARDHGAELTAVAEKLSEGSEGAAARALGALMRMRRNPTHSERELEDALEELRAVDAKGLLAYTLTHAAERDLARGLLERAELRATEALGAAKAVKRRSQVALASAVLAEVALERGDRQQAERLHEEIAGEARLDEAVSARARAAVERVERALGS